MLEQRTQALLPNSYRVRDRRYAGEYPFASNAAKRGAQLAALLDAGITSFIDLTMPADGLVP